MPLGCRGHHVVADVLSLPLFPAQICSNTDISTENACGACRPDTGACAVCGPCTACYAVLEADPTNAACSPCTACTPCAQCSDCDCDACWGDDGGDDGDGPPACLASCPQPNTEDVCAHLASILAGPSASCVDGCAGSASESEVNIMFAMCGLRTPRPPPRFFPDHSQPTFHLLCHPKSFRCLNG